MGTRILATAKTRTSASSSAKEAAGGQFAKHAGQERETPAVSRLEWSFREVRAGALSPTGWPGQIAKGQVSQGLVTPGALQRKLMVNAPDDRFEQEADHAAEQVMRMAEPGMVQGAAGTSGAVAVQRKCAHCEEEDEKKVQRKCAKCEEEEKVQRKDKNSGEPIAAGAAPPIVHEALQSPGRPLEAAARAFFEPRMGYDFSRVRIHYGGKAAESATAVNALAYTVGSNIVFGDGQYAPGRPGGNRLLAHELTHVIQQDGASNLAVQRAPCRSAAQCSVNQPGSLGTAADQATTGGEALAKASGGVAPVGGGPTPCLKPRHGERAVNIEALAAGAGLGVAKEPELAGFFIQGCMAPGFSALTAPCRAFPGGSPAGAPPDKFCSQVPVEDEDAAKAIAAKPTPSSADKAKILSFAATVKHESQHAHFDTNAKTIVSPSGGCSVDTVVPVPSGGTTEDRLTEISAEIAEFDVFFRNREKIGAQNKTLGPGRKPNESGEWAMQTSEHNIAIRGGENILDNIKELQCACDCGVVDKFVEEVFAEASRSWTPEEKKVFNKAMTDFIPSFWPKALRVT
jgi:hypothetical protein